MARAFFYSLFQDSKQKGIKANGILTNGKAHISKNDLEDIPTVEITDSPTSLHRRLQKASSIGSFSAVSEDSRSPDEGGRPSSAGSRAQGYEREASFSPSQSLILSPNRKSTDALKKVYIASVLWLKILDTIYSRLYRETGLGSLGKGPSLP